MATVMISCGEASGDLYAGALATELRALDPGVRLWGFGGERLRAGGAELAGDYRGLAVTGIFEVARVLPRTLQLYRRLVARARASRPDVFVAVDFPDFNFRLAAAMRRLGVPVVYYVSPQLWAWRPGRLATIKRLVERVLVIFPFEEAMYRDAGVPVEFVGHPLVDLAGRTEPRDAFLASLGLDPRAPVLALLPGSRRNEVTALLPELTRAVRRLHASLPGLQVVVARAPNLDDSLFGPLTQGLSGRGLPALVEGRTDDVLAASDVVVTASGTATVQAALHERPMVIVYKLSAATYRLGKPFVKVDTYGMANLIAGRRVVPELIQDDFTAEAVEAEVLRFLTDDAHARATREALATVRARLGSPGASRRAAEAVLAVARSGLRPLAGNSTC